VSGLLSRALSSRFRVRPPRPAGHSRVTFCRLEQCLSAVRHGLTWYIVSGPCRALTRRSKFDAPENAGLHGCDLSVSALRRRFRDEWHPPVDFCHRGTSSSTTIAREKSSLAPAAVAHCQRGTPHLPALGRRRAKPLRARWHQCAPWRTYLAMEGPAVQHAGRIQVYRGRKLLGADRDAA